MPIIITNRCGVDGTVDHEFMVTMKPPPPNSNGRRLGTQDLLSYLQGWAHQYDPEDTPNGATRRKLQANSSSDFHVLNFFTATQLGVAVSASNEVSGTPTARTRVEQDLPATPLYLTRPRTCSLQTIARMCNDPAVLSIECDCLQHQLTTYPGAPWGLDRIDGVDDKSFDDGDLTGSGVRVYVVDDGVQGSHVDFGGRVVSGHTVLGPLAHAHCPRPLLCDDILRAASPARAPCFPRPSQAIALPTARPHTQHPLTTHHPFTTPLLHPHPSSSVPLAYPSRSLTLAPSAPRAKRSTVSSPPTALGAKGTAPTSPRPSAAKCTVSLRA